MSSTSSLATLVLLLSLFLVFALFMILSRYSPLPQPFPRHQVLLGEDEAVWDNSDPMNCTNGIQWILNVFGDCVDTNLKLSGFIVGFISLVLWLVPLFPQLLENYRTKRCEGLSIFFLLFWITGDTCNMIGAILTHQQPLQQIIGVYYILQDIVLLSQFVYYTKVYHASRGGMANSSIIVPMLFVGVLGTSSLKTRFSTDNIELHGRVGRSLLSSRAGRVGGMPIFESYSDAVGYAIGSVAAVCYFAGRIPQLLRNYYRKSCDGLSIVMFYIIVLANLTYGFSVLLESTGWLYILRHFPWLAGSFGCCFFDAIVILQYYHYKRRRAEGYRAEEEAGLLDDQDGQIDE